MRKKTPAVLIVVAFLFAFVLSSCASLPARVGSDSDKDGVFDNFDYRHDFTTRLYYDKCPTSTPAGAKVDQYGCHLDSDEDGVADDFDKCPGTPKGVKVEKDGCPLDSDGDGVPDYLDKCPGTPKGVKVDKDGCPLDSDGDGVPDYLDKCPGTPAGVKTDKDGCPLDSDGDGVPDYLDKCPGTPAGVEVDQDGCPMGARKMEAAAGAALEEPLKVEFDTGKSDVKKKYHEAIGKLAAVMKKYPDLKIALEGHTDNVGGAAYNEKLSQRRVDAVKKYLVEKFGIEASRLNTKGYGLTRPIAPNATKEGRQKNRRVETAAK